MTISACLIVRDEERFLDRCLASLHGIVDEICLLDTGSKDRTLEIARSHGARIGSVEWMDDFSRARNACLEMARGEWILQIDADEELCPPRRSALESLGAGPAVCHLVEVELRGGGGIEVVRQPRLFRRDPRLRYTHALHETILDALAESSLPAPSPLDLRLIHHGYQDDVVASRGKLERNLRILRSSRDRGASDAYDLFKLAVTLEGLFDPLLEWETSQAWTACIEDARRRGTSLRRQWPWWPRAVAGASLDLWANGELGAALECAREFEEECQGDSDFRTAVARLEEARGNRVGALEWLDAAPDARLEARLLFGLGRMEEALDRSSSLPSLRALLLVAMGQVEAAFPSMESALKANSDDAETVADLAAAFLLLGDRESASNLLARTVRGTNPSILRHRDLKRRVGGLPPDHPPRDVDEASSRLVEDIRSGAAPWRIDPGFPRQELFHRIADILEKELAAGREEEVRRFARGAPAWAGGLPGVERLVEGD
ncbi:MAG: glycosyltransferase [Fibrobacteria bacterium]|nr:glycosyltransferase [Fibrobacteria bacterium]